MQIGLVGLGRMGGNMRDRMRASGIAVVGYDRAPGSRDVDDLAGLVAALDAPRTVWIMVPAGAPTDQVVDELAGLLSPGDLVIDGGNTRFTDDAVHAAALGEHGIDFVDAGVSGGVWGKANGYGLMVGGADSAVARAMPIFDALRPDGPRAEGFVHVGPVGAGHYAKMVHNGIEYALMQAYAEGYELLAARSDLIADVPATFAAWQRGTVVRSWLLELLVQALNDPEFQGVRGVVDDSGEGRWTIEEAIEHAVPDARDQRVDLRALRIQAG